MAINDVLSNIAICLGLKKSEEQKLVEAISKCEDRIKTLNDKMSEHVADIQAREAQLRVLREKYNNAGSAAVKETFALQMRTILNAIKNSSEVRTLIARDIEKENDLLRNLKIALEALRHPASADEINELADIKAEIVGDAKDEDVALKGLRGTTYKSTENPVSEEEILSATGYADKESNRMNEPALSDPDLERELDELLGKAETPATDSGNAERKAEEAHQ